ncbi:MAG TPA: PIN domain-containing protein [Blastocatellia bacterium]|nr:PIN domain-containing protein [Blastocatellia bacterium]
MYLLDTNVWLERLLGQTHAEDVRQLLEAVPAGDLFITDFAFHSICVILTRLKKAQALEDFVEDLFIDGAVTILTLQPEETADLLSAMRRFKLDFDDAYQYIAAEKYALTLVSFDNDLKRTPSGKQSPAEVLAAL